MGFKVDLLSLATARQGQANTDMVKKACCELGDLNPYRITQPRANLFDYPCTG